MTRNCPRTGLDTARLCTHHIAPGQCSLTAHLGGPGKSPGLRGDAAGARPTGNSDSCHRSIRGPGMWSDRWEETQGVREPQAMESLSTAPPTKCYNFVQINKHWKWMFKVNTLLKVKVAQLCPTICNPMDYTVHGILQARILEWVAFPFSRGSSQPRDQTQVSHIAGRFFTSWATRETQEYWSG